MCIYNCIAYIIYKHFNVLNKNILGYIIKIIEFICKIVCFSQDGRLFVVTRKKNKNKKNLNELLIFYKL